MKSAQQHSFLRLWRGYVFREHINPDARWWGWADPDTFLGNFDTQCAPSPFPRPIVADRRLCSPLGCKQF
ncbi:hypothetical protein CALCODRAFT_494932 [Calocera cornea HHB12733]|uniref:Uncharacterized protein n=1 Tax=Calocera cornea HHB12733 TaxID=1353952 RepID=A0A165GT05_9BASI|nr:hypothetical protein CALCODRAFT_494932 [Calocera cornea HHB12733]